MANRRIYYATQAVALKPVDKDGTPNSNWYYPRGLQSVGMTTNFNLTQVFQLGQLELYDNMEDVPEIEVTMTKNIDGTPPLYLIANAGTGSPSNASGSNLAALSNNRVHFRLMVFADTLTAATGAPSSYVNCSGMYLSSIRYNLPVDGVSTEEITLVGNHKVWNSGSTMQGCTTTSLAPPTVGAFAPASGSDSYPNQEAPASARRYKIIKSESVFPTGDGGFPSGSPIQSVNISCSLGREPLYELGSMSPYFRYVTFPIEVTSEIESIAVSGDNINADDFACGTVDCSTTYKNLTNKEFKVVICGSGTNDKLTIDLGNKNKLTSVNYTGGDTGGGNASVTYSFRNFNDLIVTGEGSFISTSRIDNT